MVLPSLGWAQSYAAAFSALICLWIGQQSSSQYWSGQVRPEFLDQAKYAWKSPVNHHWCENLRDRSERWIYPIYMTNDIPSLFCSNPFKYALTTNTSQWNIMALQVLHFQQLKLSSNPRDSNRCLAVKSRCLLWNETVKMRWWPNFSQHLHWCNIIVIVDTIMNTQSNTAGAHVPSNTIRQVYYVCCVTWQVIFWASYSENDIFPIIVRRELLNDVISRLF